VDDIAVDNLIHEELREVMKEGPDCSAGALSRAARPSHAEPLHDAFERHIPILLATARSLVHNEADARDLVQTTLEIAMRRSSDLRDPMALRSWLLTIQSREAFRLRRRLSRFARLDGGIVDTAATPGPEPDAIALQAALRRLPPRARTAVVLHYQANLSVSEVSRVMGVSENTTKGHLKAGLARLREELRDD
jgi:RNA polymerase sigma-70 factor (ECF subfamily)